MRSQFKTVQPQKKHQGRREKTQLEPERLFLIASVPPNFLIANARSCKGVPDKRQHENCLSVLNHRADFEHPCFLGQRQLRPLGSKDFRNRLPLFEWANFFWPGKKSQQSELIAELFGCQGLFNRWFEEFLVLIVKRHLAGDLFLRQIVSTSVLTHHEKLEPKWLQISIRFLSGPYGFLMFFERIFYGIIQLKPKKIH